MICIPYIVNDNYKVARLEKSPEVSPCYIIETDSTDYAELFSFEPAVYGFDPDNGFNDDAYYQIDKQVSFVTCDPVKHHAEVKLVLKKHEADSDNKLQNTIIDELEIEDAHVSLNLGEIDHQLRLVSTVNVTLVIIIDDDELHYRFSLNIANKDHIYDIVIDFGSEASQIWYLSRNLNAFHIGNRMQLFRAIKDSFSLSGVKDNDIYQYEPSDETLYRSLFFINKNIPSRTVNKSHLTFINKEADLMTMLSTGGEVALPNMKIMDYPDVQVPYITVNRGTVSLYQKSEEIRSEILKFFFETVFGNIKKTISEHEVACKVTFLVPNTYTQTMLSDIHIKLIEDVKSSLTAIQPPGTQDDDDNSRIVGDAEVATFSESDASFFGEYDVSNFHQTDVGKHLLIVDIGKGTSDFSVLRISSTPDSGITMDRVARSGLVGAGNVMTFAVLASVINQIACRLKSNKSDTKHAIQNMAYHRDRAKKNQLYRELEQLKCRPDGPQTLTDYLKSISLTGLTAIGALTIEKITEILKDANSKDCVLDENDCIINQYAAQVSSMLIEKLKYVYDEDVNLDQVIFSGRGAKSKILTTKMIEDLQTINHDIDVAFMDDADKKSACLKGPFNRSMQFDRMNMSIVGWPRLKQRYSSKVSDPGVGSKRRKKSIFDSFEGWWKKKVESTGERLSQQDAADEILSGRPQVAQLERAEVLKLVQGHAIDGLRQGTNTFMIGCHHYTYNYQQSRGEVRVYYDGRDFLLREATRSQDFNRGINQNQKDLVTETLFPVTEHTGGLLPDMPVLDEVLAAFIEITHTNEEQTSTPQPSQGTYNNATDESDFDADESDFDAD